MIAAPTAELGLWRLHRQALEYFLDNQEPGGLVLDRQRNAGSRRVSGLCSTATTGMGCIALALASASPHRLLTPAEAASRVAAALHAALEGLPHDAGILPHFIDPGTGDVVGADHFSTIDSTWMIAGALWAAEFLRDAELEVLSRRLADRVDWQHWTGDHESGLLRHAKDRHGRFIPCTWDRLNGETVFMYVLAAGADTARALPAVARHAWRLDYGCVAGHHFNNADLGLFVFQYGLDLLDLSAWRGPDGTDLHTEARIAALANRDHCRQQAARFLTYRRFWGISAGDGPGDDRFPDIYRAYAPAGTVDGTAHLTSALASVAHYPDAVLENIREAEREPALGVVGRYGLSSINLDRSWVARDMIGIDAGAAMLALDNYLMDGRIRTVFHGLPAVERGLRRLGFTQRPALDETRRAS